MSSVKGFLNRVRHLFAPRRQFNAEMEAEIQFHLESRAADLRVEQAGLSETEARRLARLEFGSAVAVREDSRLAWQYRWLNDLGRDLRYAGRTLRRSPAFALTAIVSLALGIGASGAVVAALDAVVWEPLPVSHPEGLVRLSTLRANSSEPSALPRAFARILEQSKAFSDVVQSSNDGLSFMYDDRAERVVGEAVSPNYFTALGVPPAFGQPFTAEVRAGRWAPQAVLSYGFWVRRFGADPGVVGRTIRLNTVAFTVVGISPASFFGLTRGSDYELRIPLLPDGQSLPQIALIDGSLDQEHATTARLAPGVSMADALNSSNVLLRNVAGTSARAIARSETDVRVLVQPERGENEDLDSFRLPLVALLVVVGVVLLIACANLASMQLARATARAREMAVRAAIGAARGRLVRQMFAEGLVIASLGGLLSIALSPWLGAALIHFLPQGHIPIVLTLRSDGRVLTATAALSMTACLLFSLFPALYATRAVLTTPLREDSAGSTGGGHGARLRRGLVVMQVALLVALVLASGMSLRAFWSLLPPEAAGQSGRVALFTIKPQPELYDDARKQALAAEIVSRLSGLPGVDSVAMAEYGPLGSRAKYDSFKTVGSPDIHAATDLVTPGFFSTAGIAWIAGRDFAMTDRPGSATVAVVNEAFARTLFGTATVIGRHFTRSTAQDQVDYEIIGLVADTHYYDLHHAPEPTAWFAMNQIAPYMPTLLVRTRTPLTASTTTAVMHELNAIDAGFPVFNIKTLDARVEDAVSRERLVASVSSASGALAIALATLGLYGVIALSVARRCREVGIRIVLGCRTSQVVGMVGREILTLVAVGGVVGGLLSVIGFFVAREYIPGLSAPSASITAATMLAPLLVGLLGGTIPVLRSCGIDPRVALRCD